MDPHRKRVFRPGTTQISQDLFHLLLGAKCNSQGAPREENRKENELGTQLNQTQLEIGKEDSSFNNNKLLATLQVPCYEDLKQFYKHLLHFTAFPLSP